MQKRYWTCADETTEHVATFKTVRGYLVHVGMMHKDWAEVKRFNRFWAEAHNPLVAARYDKVGA